MLWVFGSRASDSGFRVQVQGSGFRVQGSGFRVQGSGSTSPHAGGQFYMNRNLDENFLAMKFTAQLLSYDW
jgi:hypothetical protein